MARKRIGELLVESGLIDKNDLKRALEEQKQWGGPLGQIMVELGLVKELDLVFVLSRQLHIPVAKLEDRTIDPSVLEMVPADFCGENNLIPFHHEPVGNFLDVAMVEPLNLDTLDRLRVLTKANIRSHFTTYSTLNRLLHRNYGVQFTWQRRSKEGIRYRPPSKKSLDAGALSKGDLSEEHKKVSAPEEGKGGFSDEAHPEPEEGSTLSFSGDFSSISSSDRKIADLKALLLVAREENEALSSRVKRLEALIERDESVLRRILGFLLDKGLCTEKELEELLAG